jgi:hypothetical protein
VGGRREALTGVGHGDLVDLIGVEPDLALAALEDARGQTLLQLQRHHLRRRSPLPAVWLWRKGLEMRRRRRLIVPGGLGFPGSLVGPGFCYVARFALSFQPTD